METLKLKAFEKRKTEMTMEVGTSWTFEICQFN